LRRASAAEHASVSIIVPCYNSAATLPRAIDSVRRQSVRNWLMIIVDDGSDDATADIARAAARADPRIKILAQANAGAAAARNAGLRAADAPWTLFLDADDTLKPHALRRLLHAASAETNAAVVIGRSARVDQQGRTWPSPRHDLSDPFRVLAYECGLAIHSALVRTELVKRVGGFDESLRTAEDWDLWQRLARAGAAFSQVDAVVALYRSRSGSLSKNIERLARDTLTVMERGIRPDPRVVTAPPANAYGAPADWHYPHKLNFMLWSAARAVAAGGDGLSFLRLAPDGLPDLDVDPASFSEMLVTGMADYLALQPTQLADRWAEFAPKLRSLLTQAFPGADRMRMRDLTLLAMKNRVGARFDGKDAVEIAEVHLDISEGAIERALPSRAAVVQLWNRAAIGILGHHGRRTLAWAVATQLPALPLSVGLATARPWRTLAFWRAVATTLASAPCMSLVKHGASPGQLVGFLKERIRFAVRTGLGAALLGPAASDFRRAPPPFRSSAVVAAGRRGHRGAASEIPILMYHRIADGPPTRYAVPVDAFAAQMKLLARSGFWTPTLAQLREAITHNIPFPGRPVILTFDDGYRDFADNAWPILQDHKLNAVLFPVTAKVGGVADWDAPAQGGAAELMDWTTLRRLAAEGAEIGSHGATHRPFSRLSLTEIRMEARQSHHEIRRQIGRPPEAFCYPYGLSDILAQCEVADSGYSLAMSCNVGKCRITASPFVLPRIEVAGFDNLAQFSRKLNL
jgi:glycosyltransferase involved in cell wall biosynthesis/peptidoglycan/xylan/chitin deacetylase (PgdA/CDA1 family)